MTQVQTFEAAFDEVQVGDDMEVLGNVHRITRIEPYCHPVVTGGETWRIAYSDNPAGGKSWGITLSPPSRYTVQRAVPGAPRKPGLPPGSHLAYHELKPGTAPGATVNSEITVMAMTDDGRGILWEFTVRELQTQPPWGEGPVITDVKISYQAYAAFAEITEFFTLIAEQRPASMAEVIDVLEALGAVDETAWMTRSDDA